MTPTPALPEKQPTKPYEARSVSDLVRTIDAGAKPKYIFFWSHRTAQTGSITWACLSQWYFSPFCVNGLVYPTAEHYMMAEKARLFGDLHTLENILAAPSPASAKALGRTVQGFDGSVWAKNRCRIVINGSFEKFRQNPDLLAFLLATGKGILVEASPSDKIWGIGLAENDFEAKNPTKWPGLNLLGFALMEVRARLTTLGNRTIVFSPQT